MTQFPELVSKRLILRKLSHEDRDAMFDNYSDPDVVDWFFDHPLTDLEQIDSVIDSFLEDLEAGKGLTWAIVFKETSGFVGTCGFEQYETGKRGEIGFDLAKAHWGKGLMHEALSAIVNYGFDILKLEAIEAYIRPNNQRATVLLQRLGFHLEASENKNLYFSLPRMAWIGRDCR